MLIIYTFSTDAENQEVSCFDKILVFSKCCNSNEEPSDDGIELGQCQCHNSNEQLSQPLEDGIELVPINPSGPDQQVFEKSPLLDPEFIEGAATMEENVSSSEGGKFILFQKLFHLGR